MTSTGAALDWVGGKLLLLVPAESAAGVESHSHCCVLPASSPLVEKMLIPMIPQQETFTRHAVGSTQPAVPAWQHALVGTNTFCAQTTASSTHNTAIIPYNLLPFLSDYGAFSQRSFGLW